MGAEYNPDRLPAQLVKALEDGEKEENQRVINVSFSTTSNTHVLRIARQATELTTSSKQY